jgi:hypothetical protein
MRAVDCGMRRRRCGFVPGLLGRQITRLGKVQGVENLKIARGCAANKSNQGQPFGRPWKPERA